MNKRNQLLTLVILALLLLSSVGLLLAQDEDVARPFLGITFVGNEEGQAIITNVEEGTPAADAGLVVEDIVMMIDDTTITVDNFGEVVLSYAVGDEITITVQRGEETVTLTAVLGEATALNLRFDGTLRAGDRGAFLGVRVERTDEGIIIREVAPDSAAEEAGLMAGDIIVALNGEELADDGALRRVLSDFSPGDGIVLGIEREGERLDIELTLDEMPLRGLPVMDNLRGLPGSMMLFLRDGLWEIGELADDSPLAEAGLQAGDHIVAINGETLEAGKFADLFRDLDRDGTVTLTIERGEETLELDVPKLALVELFVGAMPGGDRGRGIVPPGSAGRGDAPGGRDEAGRGEDAPVAPRNRVWLGVRFLMIDEAAAAARELPVSNGVLLIEIAAFSPAEAAGLQAGDIITTVNDQLVDAEHAFEALLNANKPGDTATLNVLRGEEALSIEVVLENMPRSG